MAARTAAPCTSSTQVAIVAFIGESSVVAMAAVAVAIAVEPDQRPIAVAASSTSLLG